jgi:hypothetical protein
MKRASAAPDCGAPWERAIEEYDTGLREKMTDGYCRPVMQTRTLGWTPTCECLKPQIVPAPSSTHSAAREPPESSRWT